MMSWIWDLGKIREEWGERRSGVDAGLTHEVGERQRDGEYEYISLLVWSWRFLPLILLFWRERQSKFFEFQDNQPMNNTKKIF